MATTHLGSELQRLRLAKGLSTRKAASLVGADHSMLVRYESGQVRLPARLVAPMSVAYECTLLQVLSAAEADLNRRLDAEEKALQAKADAPDASAS